MGQKIFAIQMFFIGLFCALLARDYLGTNFIVSLIIGFVGGGAIFGVAMGLAPRVVFYGLVALYTFIGFSIARSYEWGVIETIVVSLFAGGLGWAANLRMAQDIYFSKTDPEPADDAKQGSDAGALLEGEEKSELFFDAVRCYRCAFIPAKTYERICRDIDENAGGRARAGQPIPVSEIAQKPVSKINADDQAAIVNLSELGLLTDREWANAQRILDKAIEAGSL
jgi:hypothetical protein